MSAESNSNRLYIQMHSMHGLMRSHGLELGRDEDTGGQILYVLSLAREFGKLDEVEKVDVVTRMIRDKDYPGYSERVEPLAEKVNIVRIPCEGDGYLRKVNLWPHIAEFVANVKEYMKEMGRAPDILHSNYADSGLACTTLSRELRIPHVHTAHSLGKPKMRSLGIDEHNFEEMDRIYSFSHRLRAEQETLDHADCIIISTDHERREQYGMYNVDIDDGRFIVVPPGTDLERFYPFHDRRGENSRDVHTRERLEKELKEALVEAEKPIVYTLTRPERRKNIPGLIEAYGTDTGMQELSNLVIAGGMAGHDLSEEARLVVKKMQCLIDRYRLEGKVYIRKYLEFETEVAEFYRMVARTGGIFVNPAFMEPFGLSIIEAASCGLPVVATNAGGPQGIITDGENGFLVDVADPKEMQDAIKRLLRDRALWAKFSKAGRDNALRHYSWPGVARKQMEIFKSILEGSFNT